MEGAFCLAKKSCFSFKIYEILPFFAEAEKYALKDQIRRSVISIRKDMQGNQIKNLVDFCIFPEVF